MWHTLSSLKGKCYSMSQRRWLPRRFFQRKRLYIHIYTNRFVYMCYRYILEVSVLGENKSMPFFDKTFTLRKLSCHLCQLVFFCWKLWWQKWLVIIWWMSWQFLFRSIYIVNSSSDFTLWKKNIILLLFWGVIRKNTRGYFL